MQINDIINVVFALIGGITTVIVSIGGAYMAVKTILTKHDEKIDRIEQDIFEIKEERKEIHKDMKDMLQLMNKMYSKIGVLDERTKKA